MQGMSLKKIFGLGGLTLVSLLALPAMASAATVTLSGGQVDFTAGDPSNTPGTPYGTGAAAVTGPAGTINDVNINIQESHANPDDLDVAVVTPNGTPLATMSDACGADAEFQTLRFDQDAFPMLLSDGGPCIQALIYQPSNYGEVPDPYPAPGPAAQTLTSLDAPNGGPSGGTWRLFATDDTTGNGGSITSWSVELDYTPTPATTPPGNPASPINPAGNIRQRKCKKKKKRAAVAKKKKCKKKKRR